MSSPRSTNATAAHSAPFSDLSARSLPLDLDSEVLGFGRLSIPDNPFPLEKIHELPQSFPQSYSFAPGLREWMGRHLSRFDGVILHGMWMYPNWAFLKACRRAHVPYVCFPHGMLEPPGALYGQGLFKAVKKTLYWMLRGARDLQARRRGILHHRTGAQTRTGDFHSSALQLRRSAPMAWTARRRGRAAQPAANPELNIPADRKVALFHLEPRPPQEERRFPD